TFHLLHALPLDFEPLIIHLESDFHDRACSPVRVEDCAIQRGLIVVICRIMPMGTCLIDILEHLCISLLQRFKKTCGHQQSKCYGSIQRQFID
ncbi:MAG: hypothetical protein V3U94_05240, partial [Candidatus Thorarchaeota archaeon]